MIKLDNRGFQVSLISLIMLIVSMVFGFLLLPQFHKAISLPLDIKTTIGNVVANRNIDERISALLKRNPSYIGSEYYPDYQRSVSFSEVDSVFETVNINRSSSRVSFEIKNATDLYIDFDLVWQQTNPDGYYSIDVRRNGESVLTSGQKASRYSSSSIFFPSSFFYNVTTKETKYGDYEVVITTDGASVDTSVEFQKLIERTIRIIDGSRDRNIYITINE